MPEEVKTSEIKETDDGGVEVSLKEETAQVEEKEEEKTEVQEVKEKKEDSFRNKVYAQDRIIKNLQQEIEALKLRPSAETKEPEADLDELDKLAQKDWKAAVAKIAEEKTKAILKDEKKQLDEFRNREEVSQLMEKSSQAALSQHPELEDSSSEKSQIFQNILNNNPRWRSSPDGPLLTMYEMEKELRKRGYDVDGTITEKVESEKERVIKASASALPASRATIGGNKIVLTREQKEFCDQNGVNYEDYARTLKKSGDKGGIEI